MVSTSTRSGQDRLHSLHQWLENSDTYVGPVRIAPDEHDPSLRSLQATDNIPANTPVFRIPPSLLITSKRARNEPCVAAILKQAVDDKLDERLSDSVSDSAALMLFLMAEFSKQEASFWKPWFDSLPRKFATLMTAEEGRLIGMLIGTPVLPFVEDLRVEMREMFDEWFTPYAIKPYPNVFKPAHCTYDAFLYAHAILESRAFKIDDVTILAPFADMANHACRDTADCNLQARGWATAESVTDVGLELVTRGAEVCNGQELCISYGHLANWELLVHFGFALRENTDDGVVVQLVEDDGDDVESSMRKMIILEVACQRSSLDFMLSGRDPLPSELLKCARVLLLDGAEMDNGARRDYSKSVSPRNERAVVKWLRSIVDGLVVDCDDIDDIGDADGDANIIAVRLQKHCLTYIDSLNVILQKSSEQIDALERAIGDEANIS